MNTAPVKDRRLFRRIAAKLFLRFMHRESSKTGVGLTSDVSASGLGFTSSECPPVNSTLEMWLGSPGHKDILYARGSVVWSEKASGGQYRIGVRLEKPNFMGMARVLNAN